MIKPRKINFFLWSGFSQILKSIKVRLMMDKNIFYWKKVWVAYEICLFKCQNYQFVLTFYVHCMKFRVFVVNLRIVI